MPLFTYSTLYATQILPSVPFSSHTIDICLFLTVITSATHSYYIILPNESFNVFVMK